MAAPATPIEREALSDAQIDKIARNWFCAKLGEEDGDWGPNTLNAVWCQEIGRPFARAILAASSDEDRKLMEQALRALQSFPGFVERADPIHRQRFNEQLVSTIAALCSRLRALVQPSTGQKT